MTEPTDAGGGRHYTLAQIVLHWLVAALVGVQFLCSRGMGAFFRHDRAGGPPGFPDNPAAVLHALTGALILLLVIARLAIRLRRPAPPLPDDMGRLLRLAAHLDHYALYATLVLLPLTGMAALYVVRAAGEAHQLLKSLLIALVALHLLGALFHLFVRGDGIVQRMLWPSRP